MNVQVQLPPEIWAAIFDFHHCNYYSICRVSSAFRRVATCGLYGQVELKGPGTVFRFLRTIKNKPHLATYIINLDLSLPYLRLENDVFLQSYGMIRNVLEHARNLRNLRLDLDLEYQSRSEFIFPTHPPFALVSFVSDVWCDSRVASFIEKQPSLRKLGLTGKFSSDFQQRIAKNYVPNLTHLDCNPKLMDTFIAGRPVSVLELALIDYTGDILGPLKESTAPRGIVELVIICALQIELPELINQVVEHAPDLDLLGIYYGVFGALDGLTEERLTEITPGLSRLKSLKCLVLYSKKASFDDIPGERSIIERWTRETATLAVITMPSRRRWYKGLLCKLCHTDPFSVDCSHRSNAWKVGWVHY